MKTIILSITLGFLLLSIIIIGTLYIDGKINKNNKFNKWWNKHILHKLDTNDSKL